jgi:hypothetical protein
MLKPDSQETVQNFEKRVLQKCLRITFYTYQPVNPFHFLKKHHNRCTLIHMYILRPTDRLERGSQIPMGARGGLHSAAARKGRPQEMV